MDIAIKALYDDFQDIAVNIQSPVELVYASRDIRTNPKMGMHFQRLIPNVNYICLDHLDHFNILSVGQPAITKIVRSLIEKLGRSISLGDCA